MAHETSLDRQTREQLEQAHRLAARDIDGSDKDVPDALDAGEASSYVVAILGGLLSTAADVSFVHRGTAAMVCDAADELVLTEDAVTAALLGLTEVLE